MIRYALRQVAITKAPDLHGFWANRTRSVHGYQEHGPPHSPFYFLMVKTAAVALGTRILSFPRLRTCLHWFHWYPSVCNLATPLPQGKDHIPQGRLWTVVFNYTSLDENLSTEGGSGEYLCDICSPQATLKAKKKDHIQSVHIPLSRNAITQATWCRQ